jgi:hypothetical protein
MSDDHTARKTLFIVGARYRALRDLSFARGNFIRGEVVKVENYAGDSHYDGCHVYEFRAADGALKEWWLNDQDPANLAKQMFELVSFPDEIDWSSPDAEKFRIRVTWKKVSVGEYKAIIRGEHWRLVMGDFPSEPLWTLMINSIAVAHFTTWPPEWQVGGFLFWRRSPPK